MYNKFLFERNEIDEQLEAGPIPID
jgi:hypothetical protein